MSYETCELEVARIPVTTIEDLSSASHCECIVIDIRKDATVSIPGAWVIGTQRLSQVVKSFVLDKTTKLIVYCQSGEFSPTASRALINLGYTNTSYLEGGFELWHRSKL